MNNDIIQKAVAVLRAVATERRRKIIAELELGSMTVTQLLNAINVPQPLCSKELAIMRKAGLVTVKPQGKERLYSLNRYALEKLVTGAKVITGDIIITVKP